MATMHHSFGRRGSCLRNLILILVIIILLPVALGSCGFMLALLGAAAH